MKAKRARERVVWLGMSRRDLFMSSQHLRQRVRHRQVGASQQHLGAAASGLVCGVVLQPVRTWSVGRSSKRHAAPGKVAQPTHVRVVHEEGVCCVGELSAGVHRVAGRAER